MSDSNPRQAVPFILANCAHGTVILNRLDWRRLSDTHNEFGVGTDILVHGQTGLDLASIIGGMLLARREAHGPGVIALDCGANIGTYTLEWARQMQGWGRVLSFEPQEHIYYALCGNIVINNLFNVKAFKRAIGSECGVIGMPQVDYQLPGQFGGLRLRGDGAEVGQPNSESVMVQMVSIDSINLPRLDFIKLDIEGMEVEALKGARETITMHKPYMLIEWRHAGKEGIEQFLASVGYERVYIGMDMICAPAGDPVLARLDGFFANLPQEAA